MKLVHRATVPQEAWRNGGGVTQTLLAWPTPEAWRLRVSVARIERDGPFSAYPGVTRHFAVLAGAGVELRWPGHQAALTPRSPPQHFDGALPPEGRLLAGATDDLNLMTRTEAGPSHCERIVPGHGFNPPARWRGLYTHEAAVLEVAGSEWPLPAGTLAWSTDDDAHGGAWVLHAAHAGHAFGLWLERPPA